MIHALSWFCADDYGLFSPQATSWQQRSPAASEGEATLKLIGRPVKYYGRMTAETRWCLCAASLALQAIPNPANAPREIGLLAAGHQGCLPANEQYFRDYLVSGRTLGRGNLFIYTLPTSALGEVAIALTLTGPTMYLHDDDHPLRSLVHHAERMVADREADVILAFWTDPQAAVCLAIGSGGSEFHDVTNALSDPEPGPLELARRLQAMSQRP